jgi:hypothetical protein
MFGAPGPTGISSSTGGSAWEIEPSILRPEKFERANWM